MDLSSVLTIEHGITLPSGDVTDLRDRLALAQRYGTKHFLVQGAGLESLDTIRNTLKKRFDHQTYLSFYVDDALLCNVQKTTGTKLSPLKALAKLLLPYESVVVVSNAQLTSLNPAFHDISSFLRQLTIAFGRKGRQVYVENSSGGSFLSDPQHMMHLLSKSSISGISASINFNRLKESGYNFKEHAAFFSQHVGAASISSRHPIRFPTLQGVLSFLYYIPFRERPLFLLEDNITVLEQRLSLFWKIVHESGYLYV